MSGRGCRGPTSKTSSVACGCISLALSLGNNGLVSLDHMQLSLLALVPSILGLYIGRWTRLKINEERFQQIFMAAVLLLGGYISHKSVAGL